MSEVQVPADFICPITQELLVEPVSTEDGQTYEREAIARWFQEGRVSSPVTGLSLSSRTLTPNVALKKAIATFVTERPQMEARALKVMDLKRCLERCEQDLRNAVPRLEHERVLKRLKIAELPITEAFPSSTASPVASVDLQDGELEQPEVYGTLVATFAQDLHNKKKSAEELRAVKFRELEMIDTAGMEAQAANEDLRAAWSYARASAANELLQRKQADREAQCSELESHAQPLGVDMSETLLAIRKDPSAHHKGSMLNAIAQIHCECVAIRAEQQNHHNVAIVAKKAADNYRDTARRLAMKQDALAEEIAALDAQVGSIAQIIDRVGTDGANLMAVVEWALRAGRGIMTPTSDNLMMLADAYERFLEADRGAQIASLRDMKSNGFVAKDIKTVANFTAVQFKEASFTAVELKEANFTLVQLKEATFTAVELKEANFTTVELKDANFTAVELKDANFTAVELKDANFTAVE
eukprot:CAMPEP_0180618628 /NCGR_PEP_ID=MMETSP1037_2-20121125/33671_1 /TAXON_ID=632150 /ORGANISM="Azadinium spinosum, Strain 3D9" /LENGTH=471 /DNA_ID=CAMNT_0022638659 /DNA_START=29 /DNA_END=1441 /DNA_ORIENTATION=+